MAAGCIIYIKQMDETEDEINHYRILRRIGFTNTDMIKGLAFKDYIQFRFTISGFFTPCLFAANAFMMLIGNYTLTPIFIVMVIYSLVYLIFAVISVHSFRTHH